MIRAELDFYYKGIDFQRKFNDVTGQVHTGLKIGEAATSIIIPAEVGNKVVEDIATTLIDVSQKLSIGLPDVKLMYGWHDKMPNYGKNSWIMEVEANATVNQDHLEGLICISPAYLKSVFDFRVGVSQNSPTPIDLVMAHEVFHVWQFYNNYFQVMHDMDVAGDEGLQGWNSTLSEIHAEEYAKKWFSQKHDNRHIK